MQFMKRWQAFWWAWFAAILLLSPGCSRQAGMQASSPDFASGQNLPFEQASDKTGIYPTASLAATEIPTGTSLTIRIESPVSSATSQPGDIFQAVLDSPIVIEGQTVAPRGSAVAGKVIAAKPASAANEFGYLRLALTTISLAGKSHPVQTGGTFVKGPAPGPVSVLPSGPAGRRNSAQHFATKDVEFPAERRLTFRLTQALATQD
jgi:hypothetical protein